MSSLVLLSGGLDSTCALAMTLAHVPAGTAVKTITFDYGAKHNAMEIAAAKRIAQHFGVENILVNLNFVSNLYKSSLLLSGGPIPEGQYRSESISSTIVPFRNAMMISIAVGVAQSMGLDTVLISNHRGDHAVYPDCRSPFISAMERAVLFGTDKKITLQAPFTGFKKKEVVLLGNSAKAPFALTYSCYNGREKHCGKCATCLDRKEAFAQTGWITDPTEYEA